MPSGSRPQRPVTIIEECGSWTGTSGQRKCSNGWSCKNRGFYGGSCSAGVLAETAFCQAPPNDDFTNRIALKGTISPYRGHLPCHPREAFEMPELRCFISIGHTHVGWSGSNSINGRSPGGLAQSFSEDVKFGYSLLYIQRQKQADGIVNLERQPRRSARSCGQVPDFSLTQTELYVPARKDKSIRSILVFRSGRADGAAQPRSRNRSGQFPLVATNPPVR